MNVNQMVKMSIELLKCQSNCQNANQIVKMSIKLSNCHNIKYIVLSVCRLSQRIDCVLIFIIFVLLLRRLSESFQRKLSCFRRDINLSLFALSERSPTSVTLPRCTDRLWIWIGGVQNFLQVLSQSCTNCVNRSQTISTHNQSWKMSRI